MNTPDHVITKTGARPGPSVAIFCGVHGNETAGITVVERLEKELTVEAGTVHLVHANPPAIERGARLINANLNRLFVRRDVAEPSYEHQRASELMDLLDECDALLDLHSYPAPQAPERAIPFAICEAPSFPIAALFDVPIVVSGFTEAEEGGSDGYMFLHGKTGICVELGANERPDLFVDLGFETAMRFLAMFGCVASRPYSKVPAQKQLRLSTFHKKTKEDLAFVKDFRTFDLIRDGEPIAIEGGKPILAEQDSYIIFPNVTRPVGVEAFILARDIA